MERERYCCKSCNEDSLEKANIKEWLCMKCNSRIIVKINEVEGSFVRKRPSEVKVGEKLLRDIGNGLELLEVLTNRNNGKNGKFHINLKGYGSSPYIRESWVLAEYKEE